MFGWPSQDNGFARFEHVRIPREQMLSKFAQVTPEGEYIKPPHAKLSYGGVSLARYSDIAILKRLNLKDALHSLDVSIIPERIVKQILSQLYDNRMVGVAGRIVARGNMSLFIWLSAIIDKL